MKVIQNGRMISTDDPCTSRRDRTTRFKCDDIIRDSQDSLKLFRECYSLLVTRCYSAEFVSLSIAADEIEFTNFTVTVNTFKLKIASMLPSVEVNSCRG